MRKAASRWQFASAGRPYLPRIRRKHKTDREQQNLISGYIQTWIQIDEEIQNQRWLIFGRFTARSWFWKEEDFEFSSRFN